MEKIKELKSSKVKEGNKDSKRVKEKLSKIHIDESFITDRTRQLIEEGYSDEEAKSVASKEAMIKTDNERIVLYKENPELKDSQEMIQKILIKRDSNQREINEILKTGTEKKDAKSNRQMVRLAEEKLRNLSVDLSTVKKEKEDLLQGGYPFDFSEKLSVLNGEIRLLQNKIQIIIDNPKIENGLKLRKNLEEKLVKLEGERNSLLTSKPEIVKNEKIENKNRNLQKEEDVVDEYDEARIGEDIKNSIGEKVTKPKIEKASKKTDWNKINPASWFKKDKKKEVKTNEQESGEKDIKKKIILSSTGAAPVFLSEDGKDLKKQEDIDTVKVIDEKIKDEKIKREKEKSKIFLSHTGAAPAFREEGIEKNEKNSEPNKQENKTEIKENIAITEMRQKLGKVHEDYSKELKKCLAEMDKQKSIDKVRASTFNILAGVKNIFSKEKMDKSKEKEYKEEDFYTEEYKKLEQEYKQAKIELGKALMEAKKEELIKAGLSGDELEKALDRVKATDILNEVIVDERQKIIDQRARANKNILTKTWNTYKEMPRWKKALVGTLLFIPVSTASGFGAVIAAKYGLASLVTLKFGASMGIGMVTSTASAVGFDLAYKNSNLEFYNKIAEREKKMNDQFIKGEINEKDYQNLKLMTEQEKKDRLRTQMIIKIATSIGLGMGAGALAYGAMGEGIENVEKAFSGANGADIDSTQVIGVDDQSVQIPEVKVGPNQTINTPDINTTGSLLGHNNIPITDETIDGPIFNPNHIVDDVKVNPTTEIDQHIENTLKEDLLKHEQAGEEFINKDIEGINATEKIISAKADGGQGAISTLRELQENLRAQYPEGTDMKGIPDSIKHMIDPNTDPHDLARDYGLYKPEEGSESAKVFVGDKITINKDTGEVIFHHVRGGEDILQKGVEYKGDMFDAGRSNPTVEGGQADPFADSESIPGSGEAGSDFLKNNPQIAPDGDPYSNSEDIPSRFLDNNPQISPETNEAGLTNNEVDGGSKNVNDFNREEVEGGRNNVLEKELSVNNDELSPRDIRQIDRIFDRNLDRVFPERGDMNVWSQIKNGSAADIYYGESFNNLDPQHESLNSYLHKIHEVTGIEPMEGNWLRGAETNVEFIDRGLKEAALQGKLDKIKL